MTRRGRGFAIGLAALTALLFVGRWTAVILADRWWGAQFSPGAASFLTQWHILRLTLQVGCVVVAVGWFVGHLLSVYRAIGSVQIPRHVGNVEILEALSPRILLLGAVGLGVLLGLLVGTGAPIGWRTVALAWHGVTYGVADPLLGNDLGLYVAQLPLWRAVHGFALLLTLVGFGGVLTLYLIVGAVRWIDGRPAINGHARRHLGWLLATLALVLAWGYLLEPYEHVAGLAGQLDPGGFRAVELAAPALTGTALMVAVLSAAWALRPRHTLLAASWIVLGLASAAGHYLMPALMRQPGRPPVEAPTLRRLEAVAFDLEDLEAAASPALGALSHPPSVPIAIWDRGMVARLAADSAQLLAVEPGLLPVDGTQRPVWLMLTADSGGIASLAAVADDRVSAAGGALFYRTGDTLAYPTPYPLVTLSPHAARPLAPVHDLGPDAMGIRLDGWGRRLVLTWALQLPGVLTGSAGDRAAWHLPPTERLAQLAPYADWGNPVPRLVAGRLVWLVDGFVNAGTFPIVARMEWRDRPVGSVHAGFLGTVDAASGETHIYVRPNAAAPARAWAEIAAGVVEPASAIPPRVGESAPYPESLFELQAAVLGGGAWDAGEPIGRPDERGRTLPAASVAWPGSGGPLLVAAYQRPAERHLQSLLVGASEAGHLTPRLIAVDSAGALPGPASLEATWSRFPLFDQVRDSVRGTGGAIETGPVRFWIGGEGLAAYQTAYGTRGLGRPMVAWVSVATGGRVGAGREMAEAWSNQSGQSVPVPPGTITGALAEARRWMRLADSALRQGDWAAFGRAFAALQTVLQTPANPPPHEAK